MENVSKYVPKNSFCFFRHQREKQSSSYGAYRNMVDRKYTETSCPDKPFNSRMESRDNQYENRRSSYKIPADNGIINSPFLLLQFLAIHFVNSEVIFQMIRMRRKPMTGPDVNVRGKVAGLQRIPKLIRRLSLHPPLLMWLHHLLLVALYLSYHKINYPVSIENDCIFEF